MADFDQSLFDARGFMTSPPYTSKASSADLPDPNPTALGYPQWGREDWHKWIHHPLREVKDFLNLPNEVVGQLMNQGMITAMQKNWLLKWEADNKPVSVQSVSMANNAPPLKANDSGKVVLLDSETWAIVHRYSEISSITMKEALRRIVLNQQAEEVEELDYGRADDAEDLDS